MFYRILSVAGLAVLFLAGCNLPTSKTVLPTTPVIQQPAAQAPANAQAPALPAEVQPAPTQAPAATATPVPSPTATLIPTPVPTATTAPSKQQAQVSQRVGPDTYPAGINPLTGLPVPDAKNLSLAPALVSITNFPITARPQAGLSYAPIIYELYIGEGMTRFLAMFYGEFPAEVKPGSSPASTGAASGQGTGGSNNSFTPASNNQTLMDTASIGPIRSGRRPFESLRSLYSGFLVMASAATDVSSRLNQYTNVFGSDSSDINSAMIKVNQLEQIAAGNSDRLDPAALSGMLFDPQPPASGKPAKTIWIPWSFQNQVFWRYDAESGSYLRFQDQADGTTFVQATDRLNGAPLTVENVVVLFVNHTAHSETLIDLDLMYMKKVPALLFRDGKMQEIFWTTVGGEYEKKTGQIRPIRFIDAAGNPVAFKPGQTWMEIVPSFTMYDETVDSSLYFHLANRTQPGSGIWAIRFQAPKITK